MTINDFVFRNKEDVKYNAGEIKATIVFKYKSDIDRVEQTARLKQYFSGPGTAIVKLNYKNY